MAAKSATSLTKPDAPVKAFATFRVAGDKLVPETVTRFLKIQPTLLRHKGKIGSTGRSSDIIPSTNVWFFSTEQIIVSDVISDHLALVLYLIGLESALSGKNLEEKSSGLVLLRKLLDEQSAVATLTLFWHGGPNSELPEVSSVILDLLKALDIATEVDFDRDERRGKSARKTRAA